MYDDSFEQFPAFDKTAIFVAAFPVPFTLNVVRCPRRLVTSICTGPSRSRNPALTLPLDPEAAQQSSCLSTGKAAVSTRKMLVVPERPYS
jgi:hypothetical protein